MADNLAVARARLLDHVDWLLEEPTTLGDRETSADIRDFIAAYDAQAARLAAQQPVLAAAAAWGVGWHQQRPHHCPDCDTLQAAVVAYQARPHE